MAFPALSTPKNMHYVQMPAAAGITRSAAAGALFKGIAVHALFHGGVRFVCADADCVQCAVVLRAEIVAALFHGAADAGILLFIHDRILLSAAAIL